MNIDQLRYFTDLAKTGSMNTTAKRMFISQPALSESIKRLEEELGCTLLLRSKTGITFTEDGMMVLEHAIRMLDHHDQIQHNLQLKYDKGNIHGKLVIGVGPVINDTFLPDLLVKMSQEYPHISLSVLENSSDLWPSLLDDGIIDIGLVGLPQESVRAFMQNPEQFQQRFHVQELFETPIVCVMEKSHPLAIYETLSKEQLQGHKRTVYGNDASYISSTGALHISTNAKVHQQFMKNAGTICNMPYLAFLSLYSPKEFVCRPVTDAEATTVYLVCNKYSLEQQPEVYQAFIDTVSALSI